MQYFNKDVGSSKDRTLELSAQNSSIDNAYASTRSRILPDRSRIQQAQKRYAKLSTLRLNRLRSLLLPAQRYFLDLLPALFHYNHPVLPGYGSSHTPYGIDRYQLNAGLKKRMERSFSGLKLSTRQNRQSEIMGLYLIGSSGSLAQSQNSDLDCWICFKQPLDRKAENALNRKANAISAWAQKFRLEFHFFIMHEGSFREERQATNGGEDCGTTQHFLLLDEFYRTATVLAGRDPLWSVVPESDTIEGAMYACKEVSDGQEPQVAELAQQTKASSTSDSANVYDAFAKKIIAEKFVKQQHYIDFGSIGEIPIKEYLGASIWALYKALQSPYKAVIKLMLLETYIAKPLHEQSKLNTTLSTELKWMLHNNQQSIVSSDPYLNIYYRIEDYLVSRKQFDRLELLRRCFYRKVGIKISRLSHKQRLAIKDDGQQRQRVHPSDGDIRHDAHWREKLMLELVEGWQWSADKFVQLDDQTDADMTAILLQREEITAELLATYRLIDQCARKQLKKSEYTAHRESQEMKSLERHLKVVYRHSRYKVGYKLSNGDQRLKLEPWRQIELNAIKQTTDQNSPLLWRIKNHSSAARDGFRGDLAIHQAECLRESDCAEELILWCLQEGIAGNKTQFYARKNSLTAVDAIGARASGLNNLLNQLSRRLSEFFDSVSCIDISINHQQAAPKVNQCLVLVNANIISTQDDLWDKVVLTQRDDPLAYTGMPRNEIKSLSLCWSNTWGEIFCREFTNATAIQQMLQFYLSLDRTHCCKIEYACLAGTRPNAIEQRLRQLHTDCLVGENKILQGDGRANNSKPGGFAFSTADGIYLVEYSSSSANPQDNVAASLQASPSLLHWPASIPSQEIASELESRWQVVYDPMSFIGTSAKSSAFEYRQIRQ